MTDYFCEICSKDCDLDHLIIHDLPIPKKRMHTNTFLLWAIGVVAVGLILWWVL